MRLNKGSVLQKGKYTIEFVLGQGSFGITYLATTKFHGPLGEISVKVAIKEFFARDLNLRHPDGTVAEVSSGSLSGKYAKDFQREAKNLSSLKHPNIINVLEAFSENNTHYYVMEYLDGGNLDDYIQSKGKLSESEALAIASQMSSALSYMHSHNMLHLDLKPRNVMRRSDGTVCLIDFGLSKQYESSGEPESSTTIGLGTPGYAPLEQGSSDERKNFAPTLDIYALGASVFKMLTGKTPPRASDIMNDGFPSEELEALGIRSETIQMIERMMSPRKKDRPQSVVECGLMAADSCILKEAVSCTDDTELLKEEAKEETEVVEASGSEEDVRTIDYKEPEQNHWKWGLLVIALLGLFAFGSVRYYDHQKDLEHQREARRQAVADSLKALEEEKARQEFNSYVALARSEKEMAKKAEMLSEALKRVEDSAVRSEYEDLVKRLNGINCVDFIMLYRSDGESSYTESVEYSLKDGRFVIDSNSKSLDASKTTHLFGYFDFKGFGNLSSGINTENFLKQTFLVEIKRPDGGLVASYDSSYDSSSDTDYYEHGNKVWLDGWGSSNPGFYQSGTYYYSVYTRGRKLFSVPITFR